MRAIKASLRFLLMIGYVICCLFLITVVFPLSSSARKARIIRRWTGAFLSLMGIRLILEGLDKLPAGVRETGLTPGQPGRLMLSNHVSFLDIFALDCVIPADFVAKAEIAHWPLFGAIATAVNSIFIARGDRRALLAVVQKMTDSLSAGRTLLLFPEGTTSTGAGLLPFHANLMGPAASAGATLVLVTLRYESAGQPCRAAAYVKGVGLFECLWRVLNTPDFAVRARVVGLITGDDRHRLCAEASRLMSADLGVPDPLAKSGRSAS